MRAPIVSRVTIAVGTTARRRDESDLSRRRPSTRGSTLSLVRRPITELVANGRYYGQPPAVQVNDWSRLRLVYDGDR